CLAEDATRPRCCVHAHRARCSRRCTRLPRPGQHSAGVLQPIVRRVILDHAEFADPRSQDRGIGRGRAERLSRVRVVASAGAGFLLAVLWFDLMFDVQVRGHGSQLPSEVLDSISAYYRRVTTTAHPMSRLVAAAMLVTLGALIGEVALGSAALWAAL